MLPKPFTKEGMLRTLEKHLGHLKRTTYQQPSGFATPVGANPPINLGLAHMSAASAVKDVPSPGKSPASSWNSPSQLPGTSPNANPEYINAMRGAGSYNIAGGHPLSGYQTPTPGMGAPRAQMQQQHPQQHRRVVSDMSGGPEDRDHNKRQRIYPPPNGGYVQ